MNGNVVLFYIFCLSIALTLFTQFRFSSLPIGIGECLIILVSVIVIVKNIKSFNYKSVIKNDILVFWFFSFILLFTGSIIAFLVGHENSIKNIVHDFFAYSFIILILFVLHFFNEKECSIEKKIEELIYYSVFFYSFVLIFALFFGETLNIIPWYPADYRFLGLSLNPNQLALLFTIIPFLLIKYKNKYRNNDNSKIFLVVTLSVVIGYCIKSDALFLSWLFPSFMYIFLKLFMYMNKVFKLLTITIFVLLGFLLVYYSLSLINMLENLLIVDGRFTLIRNAFDDINYMIYSGFGFGPHSYQENLNLSKYWEVHNTYIDWFTQTGLIGIVLFLYLILKIMISLIKQKDVFLTLAFLSLLVFITFHFVFRQPIFWLFMYYFYMMGKKEKKCVE